MSAKDSGRTLTRSVTAPHVSTEYKHTHIFVHSDILQVLYQSFCLLIYVILKTGLVVNT